MTARDTLCDSQRRPDRVPLAQAQRTLPGGSTNRSGVGGEGVQVLFATLIATAAAPLGDHLVIVTHWPATDHDVHRSLAEVHLRQASFREVGRRVVSQRRV